MATHTWITQTHIENYISALMLGKLTQDVDSPSPSADATIVAEVLDEVVSEVKSAIQKRYPSECAAETASALITGICKTLALRKFYVRRQDMGVTKVTAEEVQYKLDILHAINRGEMDVPEWTNSDTIQFEKHQFDEDAPEDLVDWLDTREEEDLS